MSLALACPAKVNLALSIGAPLANGYHPLASWMVAVHFADHLKLTRLAVGPAVPTSFPRGQAQTAGTTLAITFDPAAPVPGAVDWPLEKDLAYRAHQLLEERAGRTLPVHAELRKMIPTGAGLGGGSSDAAAMLVGVNRLFKLGLDTPTLRTLARKLGSDVGFLVGAIEGQPSALVAGLGESLAPLPLPEILHLVLVFPGFGCPTGEVYRAFDQFHASEKPRHADEPRVRALAARNTLGQDAPFNDLAEPACLARPALRGCVERVGAALEIPVHITGSGSTLFVLAPNAPAAKVLAQKVTAATGLAAVATRTV